MNLKSIDDFEASLLALGALAVHRHGSFFHRNKLPFDIDLIVVIPSAKSCSVEFIDEIRERQIRYESEMGLPLHLSLLTSSEFASECHRFNILQSARG